MSKFAAHVGVVYYSAHPTRAQGRYSVAHIVKDDLTSVLETKNSKSIRYTVCSPKSKPAKGPSINYVTRNS